MSGMSTCKTLDLEVVKKKRIEAIRGQILSKLRMAKEPEPDEEDLAKEIPKEIEMLYNSTVELSKEWNNPLDPLPEDEEEEYFAKEMHQFIMTKRKYPVGMCGLILRCLGLVVLLISVVELPILSRHGPINSKEPVHLRTDPYVRKMHCPWLQMFIIDCTNHCLYGNVKKSCSCASEDF